MGGLSSPLLVVCALLSLALTLAASEVLVRRVGLLGRRLGLMGGIMGLLIAFGADAPEITSGISAMANGSATAGAGVVIGSNIFNMAALFGISALVTGRIRVHREALAVDAGAGVAVIAALLIGVLGAPLMFMWLALILVVTPYFIFLARPSAVQRLGLPAPVLLFLARASRETESEGKEVEQALEGRSQRFVVAFSSGIVFALVAIVVGSMLLVSSSLVLGHRYRVPGEVTGFLILAVATSIPNLYSAVRLASAGHGAAVVSLTFNSNTLNVLAGIAIPAAFATGLPAAIPRADVLWLLVITFLAIALLVTRPGRAGSVLLLGAYAAFVIQLINGGGQG